jgi:hypothetical protein
MAFILVLALIVVVGSLMSRGQSGQPLDRMSRTVDPSEPAVSAAMHTEALAFIEAVSPEYAVISAGANNRYGHPHTEVLERLSAFGVLIYRTDVSGTIELLFSDGEITPLAA